MNTNRTGWLTLTVHALLAVSIVHGTSQAATLYVSTAGLDASDGRTWATAKRTVQAGVTAAQAGDQIWVAAGTYVEGILLKPGVALYGGFTGHETRLDQRNWLANPTILDGNHARTVVGVVSGATSTTRIDGFTIRNGYGPASDGTAAHFPGGIYCSSGTSATIVNNTITGNNSFYHVGAIYCESSSPTIANNRIMGNFGGGIDCRIGSSAMIANNTITGNDLYGISVFDSSPTIANTIVAFNLAGIYRSGGTPVMRCNCVYANPLYDYSGLTDPTGTEGNISANPRLAGAGYGNIHIQPDSPCLDAGDDSTIQPGWLDVDAQARVIGSHVDIGADESDGTVWPIGANVIVRVSPSGNDANDGSSWARSKHTVQAGIEAAAALGGDVWVQAGIYPERITLRDYTHVYGGFAGTETQRFARDCSTHVTILDGNQAGSVVSAVGLAYDLSTIDGFTIRNGTGTDGVGVRLGGGIYCYQASPRIANNVIAGNAASYGGGIAVYMSFSTIIGNTIANNRVSGRGGGLGCGSGGFPTVTNNLVAGNNASSDGGGIHASGGQAIVNNVIVGNRASGNGGGIRCASSYLEFASTVANNTVTANDAGLAGGGIYFGSNVVIANTIVAFNSSGICSNGSGLFSLHYNCLYGNGANDYSGLADPAGTNGNIAADPRFVRAANPGPDGVWGTADDDYGDLRLRSGSPCIDAASNADVLTDWADLDADSNTAEPLPLDLAGQKRFFDDPAKTDTGSGIAPIVDMGAYERPHLVGDITADGRVNVLDLLTLADSWAESFGSPAYNPACDLNQDNNVDTADLLLLATNWNT